MNSGCHRMVESYDGWNIYHFPVTDMLEHPGMLADCDEYSMSFSYSGPYEGALSAMRQSIDMANRDMDMRCCA